jgi:SAM-dependent methyltransferase
MSQMPLEEVVRVTQSARRWLKPGGMFYSFQLTEPYDDKWKRCYTRLVKPEDFPVIFNGYDGLISKFECNFKDETEADSVTSYFEFQMKLVKPLILMPDFDQCQVYDKVGRGINQFVE